jgi:hypothetical protein
LCGSLAVFPLSGVSVRTTAFPLFALLRFQLLGDQRVDGCDARKGARNLPGELGTSATAITSRAARIIASLVAVSPACGLRCPSRSRWLAAQEQLVEAEALEKVVASGPTRV